MPAFTLTPATPNRVLSVDVLRGLTIALMILVNDPGDWRHTYEQLDHARWNGFTLTDLVFPTFLFLVGMSVIFSLSARLGRISSAPPGTRPGTHPDPRPALARNIIRRAATILLVDLLIAAAPYFHLSTLRIYGVLTRIALCYLVVGLLCLLTRRAAVLASVAAALLLGYWILMRFVPVPGFGIPTHAIPLLDPDRNLVALTDRAVNAFLQRTLHTGSLYERTRDPEGLLSTLPAIATTLIGALTALWLRRPVTASGDGAVDAHTHGRTLRGLLLAAVLSVAAGLLWNLTFPINKNLWTSSYVLFAAGLSLLGLSLCFFLIDILRLGHRSHLGRAVLWPWLVFGSNAITAYAMSNVFVKIFSLINIHDPAYPDPIHPGSPTNGSAWLYQHLFAHGHSTDNTSLAYALFFVLLCFLPNLLLWRKRIFLRL